jgi:hypothetical protein
MAPFKEKPKGWLPSVEKTKASISTMPNANTLQIFLKIEECELSLELCFWFSGANNEEKEQAQVWLQGQELDAFYRFLVGDIEADETIIEKELFSRSKYFAFQGNLARKSEKWNQNEAEIVFPASLTLSFLERIHFLKNKPENQAGFMICFNSDVTRHLSEKHHKVLVDFDKKVADVIVSAIEEAYSSLRVDVVMEVVSTWK